MIQYNIRHTTEADLAELMPLFDHSRQIMRDNGNNGQWVNGYPSLETIKDDIKKRVSYVITDNDTLVGTFAFIIGRDPTYEYIEGGQWLHDARPYGTIHRIASAEGRHGIFQACLDWCERQIPSIRIDTHADNRIMLQLMQKHGLRHRGTIYITDGSAREAFQIVDSGVLCEPLTEYINETIIPRYAQFDTAHRQDHALSVINNSLELARHYDVEINMVYTIAAYHDLGLVAGRERHHIVSAEILKADKQLLKWFDKEQITTMAQAVGDHRASAHHEPRSLYGKIVAEADRDIIPLNIIQRTVQYGLSNYPELSPEEQWQRAQKHLIEKYGDDGYLKLLLPESPNAARLAELRRIIKDTETLRAHLNHFFEQERTQNP